MTLTQAGTSIFGTYSYDSGKITGHLSGNVASGTWSEAPTYAGPSDAGPFTWTMSSGKSWSGTWSYANGSSGGGWSGTCTGGDCLENGKTHVTKWRFSVNARNKFGSRTVGSGIITRTDRGPSVSWRATGTIAHVDEYLTKEQDERLTLRVVAGRPTTGGATLTVVVTATSHPRGCRVGTEGKLVLHKADSDGFQHFPAEASLRVCGREHDHFHRDSERYPVNVTVALTA